MISDLPSHPTDVVAHPTPQTTTSATVDILARTVFGEARGESVRGREAVAAVVMNRLHAAHGVKAHWWGNTVEDICLCPRQFSCWNSDDPNRNVVLAVQPGDPDYDCCVRIARRAVRNVLIDPTGGATHYHAKGFWPDWARGKRPTAIIGNHVFYAGVD